jgi:hypothetical protein
MQEFKKLSKLVNWILKIKQKISKFRAWDICIINNFSFFYIFEIIYFKK